MFSKTILIISFTLSSSLAFAKDYSPKECPVVGNTQSTIYHVPGGQFYGQMLKKNENGDNRKCFQSEQEAIKEGYRKSKR